MPSKHKAGGCDCCGGCNFDAFFDYANLDSICLLTFTVYNLRNAGTPISYYTANITVVLKKNGTVISEPLVAYTDSVGGTGGRWERWKPTAGDVYTADVTLDCGGGATKTASYSYTIPTPANTACNCCNDRTPDYVVLSSLVNCCEWANGTYALDLVSGACTYQYNYASPPNSELTDPGTPAGCGVGYCGTFMVGADTWYLWPRGVVIDVVMPSTTGVITITVLIQFYGYRDRAGVCAYQSSPTVTYTYEIECQAGTATLLTTSYSHIDNCVTAPTVDLFLV